MKKTTHKLINRVSWYASGNDIAKCGPFKTQREAYEAMILIPRYRVGYCPYPVDLVVWPEWNSTQK